MNVCETRGHPARVSSTKASGAEPKKGFRPTQHCPTLTQAVSRKVQAVVPEQSLVRLQYTGFIPDTCRPWSLGDDNDQTNVGHDVNDSKVWCCLWITGVIQLLHAKEFQLNMNINNIVCSNTSLVQQNY